LNFTYMIKSIGKFFIFICLFITSFVFAQDQINPMQLPQLPEYVNDFSHMLTADQLSGLNTLAYDYNTTTTNQIITVVFPHRQWNELIDIALKIFKDNGIGQEKTDNGLLLVIASEEKKIRILVGYWLEWVYPDLMASQVIEDIRPLVNSGDFYGAVKLFYERSMQIIGWELPEGYTTQSDTHWILFLILFVVCFFPFVALIWFIAKKNKKGNNNTSWFGITNSWSSFDSDSSSDSWFDGWWGDSGGGGDGD